jgi:phosphatidylserine/phosphatidylglycerophosphate/cardiolipin synthase-like enzyme
VGDRRSTRPKDLLLAVESRFADVVSAQICSHHRRRLAGLGWNRALDPAPGRWSESDPPPRDGNVVEVLIDGAAALPAMAEAIRGATSHVHITGWYFTPGFALERDRAAVVLRNLLAEVAERVDVRVLGWAGAPLPLFRPTRDDVRAMQRTLTAGTKIRCELDALERPLHCHHEKTIVVDDRIAFVGGIDLTTESGDRFDTPRHPSRAAVGWHDAAVRVEGPAVTDVAEHFRMRWREVTRETLPEPAAPPAAENGIEVQVIRTVPEKIYRAVPRGDFGILESYVRAFRDAQRFIYAENQFLWSPELAAVLVDKIENPPRDDFRLLLVLPVRPNSGDDDTRGVLGQLIDADAGAGRVLACTIYARTASLSDPVYVHAKIGIVDDEWLTVGSANLNEHSLFNDTEMNVVMRDRELVRSTRQRLWAEHLELPLGALPDDPVEAIETMWKPISAEQLERRSDGRPLTHRLVRLPHVSKRSRRVLGPINGLFVDG